MHTPVAGLGLNLGPLRQLAYIVEDIDRAMEEWHRALGVGPFALLRDSTPFAGSGARYRGQSCEDLRLNIAFAYLGDVQLELIEQREPGRPSLYQEMLDRGNPGLHHYCFAVEDYAAAYRQLLDAGFDPVVQSGNEQSGMMYCEHRRIPGLVLEVIPWNERTRPYFDGTRQFLASVDQGQLCHEFSL